MPEISRFYGIIIYMNFNDHNPPHIHVRYNEYNAIVSIKNNALMAGKMSPKALAMVTEWIMLNKKDLLEDWELTKSLQHPRKIKPLE